MASAQSPRPGDVVQPPTSFGWRDVWIAGGLTALAALLRFANWKQTVLMFNDGPRFLVQAQHFAAAEWDLALADPYHPLYALATASVRLLLGMDSVGPAAWERAAAAVSIGAGALAVTVFYVFAKSAFGARAAWMGAVLLACNPYAVEFSSDVQSEGLFQLTFLVAVAFGWSALKRVSPSLAGWCGLASALAYLTRPEGLGVGLAACAVGGVQWLRGRWSLAMLAPWLAALMLGTFAITAPYLVWLRVEQGVWTLSQKKSLAGLTGVERDEAGRSALGMSPGAEVPFNPEVVRLRYTWRAKEAEAREVRQKKGQDPPEPSALRRRLDALVDLVRTFVSAIRPEVVVFGLFGVALARGRPGLRGQYVLAVLLVYGVLVWGLVVNYGYLSRRHVLAPGLLLLGYAALALPAIGALLIRGARRLLGRPGAPEPRAAAALALSLLVVAGLGKVLKPPGGDNRGEREAAEWIESQGDPGGAVAAGKRRVAYYAGAPWFPLRKIPRRAPLVTALRLQGVRYVVADDEDIARYRELAEPEGSGLTVVYRTRGEGDEAVVYEVGSREGG